MSISPTSALRRTAWHPATIAGCLGGLATLAALVALRQPELTWFAWCLLGTNAGFATSGSV